MVAKGNALRFFLRDYCVYFFKGGRIIIGTFSVLIIYVVCLYFPLKSLLSDTMDEMQGFGG